MHDAGEHTTAKSLHENPTSHTYPQPVPRIAPLPRIAIVLLGSCLTVGAVSYVSKDWCCAPTSGAIMAAIVIGLSDRFLLVPLFKKRAGIRKAQLLFALGCVAAFAFSMRADPENLFEEVIGVRPPPGVRHLVIDCNEMVPAGGGEQVILFRFVADRQTMEEIVKGGHLSRDDETVNELMGEDGGWRWLWEQVFSCLADSGGDPWTNVAPMKRPVLYKKQCEGPEDMKVLWDEDSGRAYVVWSIT